MVCFLETLLIFLEFDLELLGNLGKLIRFWLPGENHLFDVVVFDSWIGENQPILLKLSLILFYALTGENQSNVFIDIFDLKLDLTLLMSFSVFNLFILIIDFPSEYVLYQ